METKELKITTPEGYEIDRENSTLDCIKFKLIEKEPTYKDIARSLFSIEFVEFYYSVNNTGDIFKASNYEESFINDKNNATNEKQLKRILALNQLLNITEYYNCHNERKNNDVYIIIYDADKDEFDTAFYNQTYVCSFGVIAAFNREEDAKAVINNPNFREILNTVYKN